MKNLPAVAFILCFFFALAAMAVYIAAHVAGMLGILNMDQVIEISVYAFGSAVCGTAVTAMLASIVAMLQAWRERK